MCNFNYRKKMGGIPPITDQTPTKHNIYITLPVVKSIRHGAFNQKQAEIHPFYAMEEQEKDV